MAGTLYQYGRTGHRPEYRDFFKFPPISLDQLRSWIKDGIGDEAVGLGAVINEKGQNVGELVMPGGKDAYMVGKDGHIRPMPENYRVTFCQIGQMEPTHRFELNVTDKHDLQSQLADLLPPGERDRYIVRLKGEFPYTAFRAVNTETAKVETLPEVLGSPETYFEFHHHHTRPYQMVGVYSKKGAVDAGVTFEDDLHLHGIDADKEYGGHLNAFDSDPNVTDKRAKNPTTVEVEVMPIGHWLAATTRAMYAQAEHQPITHYWEERVHPKPAGEHRSR